MQTKHRTRVCTQKVNGAMMLQTLLVIFSVLSIYIRFIHTLVVQSSRKLFKVGLLKHTEQHIQRARNEDTQSKCFICCLCCTRHSVTNSPSLLLIFPGRAAACCSHASTTAVVLHVDCIMTNSARYCDSFVYLHAA